MTLPTQECDAKLLIQLLLRQSDDEPQRIELGDNKKKRKSERMREKRGC